MRWSQVDLDAGTLHVVRFKGSIDSTPSLDRDELRDLRKLRQEVSGLYVFETERGGPLSVDALQYMQSNQDGTPLRGNAMAHYH